MYSGSDTGVRVAHRIINEMPKGENKRNHKDDSVITSYDKEMGPWFLKDLLGHE